MNIFSVSRIELKHNITDYESLLMACMMKFNITRLRATIFVCHYRNPTKLISCESKYSLAEESYKMILNTNVFRKEQIRLTDVIGQGM